MSLRAIFFDLDDTLCDTIGTRGERARKAFERVCADYPLLEVEQLCTRALEPLPEPRAVRGIQTVLQELDLIETTAAREAMAVYVGHHGELALFPGVAATLEELKKRYLLGVISNAEGWYQHSKLEHLGIAEYFQVIVISGEVGYSKPDSRIFEMALELASVKPHEALFVGDRLDIDVTGAVAAGMHAVWFNHWGGAQPDGTGQLTIEQFRDLVSIIDRITE